MNHRPKTKDRRPKTKIIMVPGIIFLVVFAYGIVLADETQDLRKRPVAEQQANGLRLRFRKADPMEEFQREKRLVLMSAPRRVSRSQLKLGQRVMIPRVRPNEVGVIVKLEPERVLVWFDQPGSGGQLVYFHERGIQSTTKRRPPTRWTRKEITRQIMLLAKAGVDSSTNSIQKVRHDLYSAASSRRYFGSWRKAIESAGLTYDQVKRYKDWDTEEAIIAEINRLHARGEDLNRGAIEKNHPYLPSRVRLRKFFGGSWRKAIEAAGLNYEEIQKQRKWTKEKIVNEIRRLHEAGQALHYEAARLHSRRLVSSAANPQHFGSWQAAVQAAGLPYEEIRRGRGTPRPIVQDQTLVEAYRGVEAAIRERHETRRPWLSELAMVLGQKLSGVRARLNRHNGWASVKDWPELITDRKPQAGLTPTHIELAWQRYHAETGQDPTVKELAQRLQVSVIHLYRLVKHVVNPNRKKPLVFRSPERAVREPAWYHEFVNGYLELWRRHPDAPPSQNELGRHFDFSRPGIQRRLASANRYRQHIGLPELLTQQEFLKRRQDPARLPLTLTELLPLELVGTSL